MTLLNEHEAKQVQTLLEPVLYEMRKIIVGQSHLLERLLVILTAGGHLLVEGSPGLAKTLSLSCLAQVLSLHFKRIQFTPDLLPSDLVGTRIYNAGQSQFETELGPVFANFILADEINRAPAKVQSALLEVMQEGQVTIGKDTHTLAQPFLVMATQNPIESEGTYPLPEAQLDRFMMKVVVDYPTVEEELVILQRNGEVSLDDLTRQLNQSDIVTLQQQMNQVYLDPALMQYIVTVVRATRTEFKDWVTHGASPRGALALVKSSKAFALIQGRSYVTPDDITKLVHDCLRHRIILSYEALMSDITPDLLISQILDRVTVPVMQGA